MMKITKIAGLLAIAISTSACVSSNQASQNAIVAKRPLVSPAPASQKLELPYEQVARLQISQSGAAQLLDLSKDPAAVAQALPMEPAIVSKNNMNNDIVVASVPQSGFKISRVYVDVPQELVVSEANVFVPKADIVWREDPGGDRRAQVKAILENALTMGTEALDGSQEVIMSVRVKMFHALTEKARYTVGGRHNINFDYVLLDAQTGKPVSEVKTVDLKFRAYGGRRADAAERRGQTQKVRITDHVSEAIKQQLVGTTAI